MAMEIEKEYLSSLTDLSFNSKPLINMLTVLAEENLANAPTIVQTIERHLLRTEHKLSCLYLIDSILKNVGKQYVQLFTQNIVSTFASVFEKVDEKTRSAMFRLRQTWSSVFPSRKLHAIDLRVHGVDPAWPVLNPPGEANKNTIHINPKVFKKGTSAAPVTASAVAPAALDLITEKQMELLTLQIQKVELEMQCAGSRHEEMQKQKELLELRTQKAQLELQQATNKLKNKIGTLPTVTTLGSAHSQGLTTPVTTVATSSTATTQLAVTSAVKTAASIKAETAPTPAVEAKRSSSSRHKPKSKTIRPAKIGSMAHSDPRSAARADADPRSAARADADPRSAVRADGSSRATARTEADLRSAARADADPRSGVCVDADQRSAARTDASQRSGARAGVEPRTAASADVDPRSAVRSDPRSQSASKDCVKSQPTGRESAKWPTPARDPRLQRTAAAAPVPPAPLLSGRPGLLPLPRVAPPPPMIRDTSAALRPTPASASPSRSRQRPASPTASRTSQRRSSDRKHSGGDAKDKKKPDKNIAEKEDRSATEISKIKSRSSKTTSKSSKHDEKSSSKSSSSSSNSSKSKNSPPKPSKQSTDAVAKEKRYSPKVGKAESPKPKPKPKRPDAAKEKAVDSHKPMLTDSPKRTLPDSPVKLSLPDSPIKRSLPDSPLLARRPTDSPKRVHLDGGLPLQPESVASVAIAAAARAEHPAPLAEQDEDVGPPSSERSSSSADESASPAVFRTVRHSRTRKYKQQTAWSPSPERAVDVDLRQLTSAQLTAASDSVALSPPAAKRRRTSASEDMDIDKDDANDVDLRQPPSEKPAAPAANAVPETKTAGGLDDLFGSEDTDLRFVEPGSGGTGGWQQLKEARPDTFKSPLRVRAEQHTSGGDVDLRVPAGGARSPGVTRPPLLARPRPLDLDGELRALRESSEATQKNIQMILQQAEEQLRAENITWEQYNDILSQVIQVGERQKIKERRTLERRQSMTERSRRDSVSSAGSGATDTDERDRRHLDTDERQLRPRGEPLGGPELRGWDEAPVGRGGRGPWRREPEQRPLLPLPGRPVGPQHQLRPPATFSGSTDEYHDQDHRLYPSGFGGAGYPSRGGRPPVATLRGRPTAPFEEERSLPCRGRGRGRGHGRSPGLLHPTQSRYEEFEFTTEPDLPDASAEDLAAVERDKANTTSTTINEEPKEIRWYGENCICLLDWDDPRMLFFKPGSRHVSIDSQRVLCRFNEKYTDVSVDGVPHRVRLGGPTKEVFVDGVGYQVFFGGESIQVPLDGRQRALSVEGPAPGVELGRRRTDMLAGKIKLIIDGTNVVPLFLDCKPQRFDVAGKVHVLRFRDGFERMVLNGQVMRTEFGGLPLPIVVGGRKHYIRLTRVPFRVKPGRMAMKGMLPNTAAWPLPWTDCEFQPAAGRQARPEDDEPPADEPPFNRGRRGAPRSRHGPGRSGRHPPVRDESMPDEPRRDTATSSLDVLSNMLPTTVSKPSGPSYHAENPGVALAPGAAGMDLSDLLSRLEKTGLIKYPSGGKAGKKIRRGNKKEEEIKNIKEINWKAESLRLRQPGIINLLYSGIQCSSCGSRFLPEQTVLYSNHLDWHFRQNRREKEGTRRTQSRRWYYDHATWMMYEEVDDADDRVEPAFDQQEVLEGTEETEDLESMCSATIGATEADNKCQVCGESLRQFYHEELEEWHLRDCIRVEGKAYHPACFEDHKTTLLLQSERQESTDNETSMDTSAADLTLPADDVSMDESGAKPNSKPGTNSDSKSEIEPDTKPDGEDVGQNAAGTSAGKVDAKAEDGDVEAKADSANADGTDAHTKSTSGEVPESGDVKAPSADAKLEDEMSEGEIVAVSSADVKLDVESKKIEFTSVSVDPKAGDMGVAADIVAKLEDTDAIMTNAEQEPERVSGEPAELAVDADRAYTEVALPDSAEVDVDVSASVKTETADAMSMATQEASAAFQPVPPVTVKVEPEEMAEVSEGDHLSPLDTDAKPEPVSPDGEQQLVGRTQPEPSDCQENQSNVAASAAGPAESASPVASSAAVCTAVPPVSTVPPVSAAPTTSAAPPVSETPTVSAAPLAPVSAPELPPAQALMDGNVGVPESRPLQAGRIRLRLAGAASPEPEQPTFSERPQAASVKPALIGRQLTEVPPTHRGDEESGLCVIM